MKMGEVRNLRIPAEEGYGASGFPAWGIPAGGTLLFESEYKRFPHVSRGNVSCRLSLSLRSTHLHCS